MPKPTEPNEPRTPWSAATRRVVNEMRSPEMHEDVQRYLDGELTVEELPDRLRAEATAWEALLEDVRMTAVSGAPAWGVARGLEAVEAASVPAWRRGLRWLMQPRTIRVAPAPAFAAMAVLALAHPLPWTGGRSSSPDDATVYVQLFLEAPSASSVAIAGDFNSWAPLELEDADGDGVWSARLAVNPGVYEYMFVLDGSRWVTDPHAERYSDDGFGNRNAVLAILPEGGRT
jgi:hypothetical protein